MTIQFDSSIRNGQASQLQTVIGSSGTMKFFTGAVPSNTAAADPSGPLGTINLPATFLTFSAGQATLAGTWSCLATAIGTPATWRMYDGGGVCRAQGDCTTTLVFTPSSISAVGQTIQVTAFPYLQGNA